MAIVAQKRDGFSEYVVRHCAGGRLSAFLLAAFICPAVARAEVVTEPLADHPEWGYTVYGLGEDGDETAVVFTNSAEAATWTVPTDLTDVQFLVVGGGGGGGGGTWGPGGGGGGVVTGLVHSLTKNSEVVIAVGAGGMGGQGNGASGQLGLNSSFSVTGSTYVTAYGGGAGRNKAAGVGGGSGSGGGASSSSTFSGGSANKGAYDATVVFAETFGSDGGANGKSAYCSGGGGGATAAGGNGSGQKGGSGGVGLSTDITGSSITYGSGGGGGGSGTKGTGGTNAGNGASNSGVATSAKANRGGGGGGGGKNTTTGLIGGNGGSGIVVFRYKVAGNVALVPTVSSKVYTGETLTADVSDGTGYTVTQNNGGIDVGDYDVVLTLADGYTWDDSEFPGTLTFSITQAANVWTVEPAITKNSWTHGAEEPGVLTAGETQFGSVMATIAKDGGAATAFDGTLPTEAGEYIVTYAAPAATANYTAPDVTEKSVSFAVYSAEEIPPYTFSTGTLSVSGERTLSVPYSLACDVTTTKTADIYVRYALDGAETTNTVQIATGVALNGGSGTGAVVDLKPGATYWVDAYAVVDEEQSDATALESVSVPGPATGLAASATFTNDPKEFIISGSVTPGLGTTIVTVEWSLNSDSLDNSRTFTFGFGDDGVFSNIVSYAELSDSLTWRVSVSNIVTTGTWGEQEWGDATETTTKTRTDAVTVTYTWTGAGGDNLWTNVANWTASRTDNYGYPNSSYATARFTTPGAVADLSGRTFGVRDGGSGLTFASNLGEVVLRNGTLNMNSSGDDLAFGASGTMVVFDSVRLTGFRCLKFTANSPTVFTGTSTQDWAYEPWGVNGTELIVRDGTMESGLFQTWFGSDRVHHVTISNAVWTVRSASNPLSLGNVAYFRDGEDRQGRVVSLGKIKLGYTYNIVIPAQGHDTATLTAPTLDTSSASCTFRIDVTDWKGSRQIPIVKFTGADQSLVIKDVTKTLVAYDKGVDVTAKRNAQLAWSSEDNTLYYQQNSKSGLIIFIQ